jgi:hypothetical protein
MLFFIHSLYFTQLEELKAKDREISELKNQQSKGDQVRVLYLFVPFFSHSLIHGAHMKNIQKCESIHFKEISFRLFIRIAENLTQHLNKLLLFLF